jgi:hypothetical protein
MLDYLFSAFERHEYLVSKIKWSSPKTTTEAVQIKQYYKS